ncbi:MAG TPA: hypothetical protein VEY89_13055, partial [Candidatus Dormibacteraeota bacterium]|nr:hypothetical protein [Candidatus Dormibacteraeota bacterium]
MDWYRRITTLQQMPSYPDELILRERLTQTSLTAVRLAFDFGHAAAALAASNPAPAVADAAGKPDSAEHPSAPEAPAPGIGGELDQAAARLAQRIATLQSQQSALDEQLLHAAPKERAALSAQRGEIAAALNLEREIQSTVAQIERFEESSQLGDSRSSGLASQLADLQRSVPEARRTGAARVAAGGSGNALPGSAAGSGSGATNPSESGSAAATPPADGGSTNTRAAADAGSSGSAAGSTRAAPAPASTFRPESAGVIALSSEWFSLHSSRGQLTDAAKNTDALIKETDEVRRAVAKEVRGLARQDIGSSSTDAAQLAQSRQQLEAAATRFRQLSTLLVPLGEQSV